MARTGTGVAEGEEVIDTNDRSAQGALTFFECRQMGREVGVISLAGELSVPDKPGVLPLGAEAGFEKIRWP